MKKKLILSVIFSTLLLFVFRVSVQSDEIITNLSITEGVVSSISVGSAPFQIAINNKTNRVYVANLLDNIVSVIDGRSNSLIKNVVVGESPRYIGVNLTTKNVYAANKNSNTVSVIDGDSNDVIATINVNEKPFGVGVNSKTNKVYVANEESNNVSVIDGSTNSVIKTIEVGEKPQGVACNNKTNKIYVVNSVSNSLSVIDGITDTVLNTIQNVGNTPVEVIIDEEKNKVYVLSTATSESTSGGVFLTIDGAGDTILRTDAVASNPSDIAFHPATGKIYVTHTFNSTVEVFDTKNNRPLYTLNEISDPAGIDINRSTNAIYICSHFVNSVVVVEDSKAKIKSSSEKPDNNTSTSSSSTSSSGGGTESPLVSQLQETLQGVDDIQVELKQASKFGRPVSSKIDFLVKKFKDALTLSSDKCNKVLNRLTGQLDSAISQLESRSCSETKTRRCIPADIVDDFLTRFEEQSGLIQSIVGTDDNADDISDVCE